MITQTYSEEGTMSASSCDDNGLVVQSPFKVDVSFFNADDFSDMNFVLPGMKNMPLHLHRLFLGGASSTVAASIKGQDGKYCRFVREIQPNSAIC